MSQIQKRKIEHFHLNYLHDATFVGNNSMPLLKATCVVPRHVISYTEIKQTVDKANYFVDFFVDDYRFKDISYLDNLPDLQKACLLNNLFKMFDINCAYNFSTKYELDKLYAKLDRFRRKLKDFEGVIGLDFSMYPEMHPNQRKWNCFRTRGMAYYFQINGFNVIPTVSWCSEDDFEYCFDGIPKHSSVAISSNGCKNNEYSKMMFLVGVEELQRKLEPSTLIVCGSMAELEKYNNVFSYPSFSERRNKRRRIAQEKRDRQLLASFMSCNDFKKE